MHIIVILLLLGLIIGIAINSRDKIRKIQGFAQENLGKCTTLQEAPKRLYPDGKGNMFLLQSFIPIKRHINPAVAPEMRIGQGLISHPEYPNNPLFVELVFKWPEKIILNTLYILKEMDRSIYYLEKV